MKTLDHHKAVLALTPAAHRQFIQCYEAANLALEQGRHREFQIFKAKALVLATMNCPLRGLGRGLGADLGEPGHIEGLSEEDLAELIASLEGSPVVAA